MATWKDGAFGLEDGDAEMPTGMDQMFQGFPELASFFLGEFDEKGQVKVGPGSISMWCDEGRLKVCLKLKLHAKVGFTTLKEPSKAFHELERLLSGNDIDWRKEGVQKRR